MCIRKKDVEKRSMNPIIDKDDTIRRNLQTKLTITHHVNICSWTRDVVHRNTNIQ